jgi:lipopolysaccharide heptosyltransferase I
LSAIGDIVHTLPCLAALRAALPDAFIGWIVEDRFAPLLESHPQLNELYVIPKTKLRRQPLRGYIEHVLPLLQDIRLKQFDVAIDFQGLTKSGVMAWRSGAPVRIGFGDADGRELNRLFMTKRIIPFDSAQHVVERNLCLLRPLGIEEPRVEFVLQPTEEARTYVKEFFEREGFGTAGKFVFLNPGAGWITKRWLEERFAELGVRIQKDLHRRVLLTWGPGEHEVVERIAGSMKCNGVVPVIALPTNLKQLLALLEWCELFVGGDTGPLHMAAALGVAVIGIFGGSDGQRNGPYGARNVVIQQREFQCVPCWKTTCRLCGSEHLQCLHTISAETVFEHIQDILTRAPRQ